MATLVGPLTWIPIRYGDNEVFPVEKKVTPKAPPSQTRVAALHAESKRLQIELDYLCDSTGPIAQSSLEHQETLSMLRKGKTSETNIQKVLAEHNLLSRKISDLHFKIARLQEFSHSVANPRIAISYGIKLFLENEYKIKWDLDLQGLCGTNGFNGSIHDAWIKYEIHRGSPESKEAKEAFGAYKALDDKRIDLEKKIKLLDIYLEVNSVHEMEDELCSLKRMLDDLCRAKGGLNDLEAKHSFLIPEMEKTGAILHALGAKETYARFLARREKIIERLAEIDVLTTLPALPTDRPGSTKELITVFDSCWDPTEMEYHEVPYNRSIFIMRAESYNRQFNVKPETDNTIGFIGRKIVGPASQIFVRADLHGDLRSLVENLKKLQELGLMDEDFTCAPSVQLVLLGDYMDRGSHSMQLLELLMALRMQNPHHITLIRGNHETIGMNINPRLLSSGKDQNFKLFLTDEDCTENKKLLDQIYQTMPLAYFIGEKNPEGIQYTMFTHGLFELYADPQKILASTSDEDLIMSIERAPSGAPDGVKSLFSKRVKALPYQGGKDYPSALRETSHKPLRKILKIHWAAQRINALAHVDSRINTNLSTTSFYWGDVQEEGLGLEMGNPSERKWKLPPEDIKLYMYLISEPKAKVKLLFRGHEHLKEHHCYTVPGGKEKIVATTMPVGMDSQYVRSFPTQKDTAYLITTAPKVKDWSKSAMEREPGTSVTTMGPVNNLRSKAV